MNELALPEVSRLAAAVLDEVETRRRRQARRR